MADGVEQFVSGPRYDVNLAEVGKPEEMPVPDVTKAFQTATNLVETAWVNQYQYKTAQLQLQEAQTKLAGLKVDNDLQQQNFDQRAQEFPLLQRQRQLNIDQGAVNLKRDNQLVDEGNIQIAETKRQLAERDKVNSEWSSYATEANDLDYKDPDFYDKKAALDAKYPDVQSSPYTQTKYNNLWTDKTNQRNNSSQQKVRDFYSSRLTPLQDPALPGGALVDVHTDVNGEVARGNGPKLWQQAQQAEATRRLRAVQARATDPTDKVMIGRLLNEVNTPPGGVSHYGADGTLDSTMSDQIAGYEQKYGVVNPYQGAKKTVETGTDKDTGKPYTKTTIENLPVTGADVKRTEAGPTVAAPAGYKYNYAADQDAVAAREQITKENPAADPNSQGFVKRVSDRYHELRQKKGLTPEPSQTEINQQYQGTVNQKPPASNAVTPAPGSVQPNISPAVTPTPTRERRGTTGGARRDFAWIFPENEAPPGSWQRAWNETVGKSLASNLTDEAIQRRVQESERRASFASTESGLPDWYRPEEEQPSASPGDRGGVNNYKTPEGAAAVGGIAPSVWGKVMDEEGPEFGPDGKHPSVFGLWGDKAGVEGDAYNIIRQHGSHSLEAYNAVTGAWMKGFLGQSQPWRLSSPGMQELVIADSQHRGGASAATIINEMGGWDRINQMDPKQAIAEYSARRTGLWPGNQGRVRREESWALANS